MFLRCSVGRLATPTCDEKRKFVKAWIRYDDPDRSRPEDLDSELFSALTADRIFWGFTSLDMATW